MPSKNTAQGKSDQPPLIDKSIVLRLIKAQMNGLQEQAQELLSRELIVDTDSLSADPDQGVQQIITHASLSSSLTELKSLYHQINAL
ncbi:hypothetical protein [Aureispira anguillae]|uniref:Uncharacterized protein n=1 Tax=Aureispira anguillae TaxID=2864201 RepID=A0A916DT76_9BACT|nr:hypothetical protein [Aureispira anguillae]BDS12710.1 hypothetical protein AsAng_0034350 [Aureispira anguillae]BDS12969.1 hypothetical protein AsAng_0036970 [Aureispira anguillae]BDS13029.1 hypothetical protein AsAng_0037570 [Aureispira anguillae]BDS13096.1 hypothetical protein AsAng_0038240 [Aureispira anguillae]